jgi:hypothetical protein
MGNSLIESTKLVKRLGEILGLLEVYRYVTLSDGSDVRSSHAETSFSSLLSAKTVRTRESRPSPTHSIPKSGPAYSRVHNASILGKTFVRKIVISEEF